MGFARAGGRIDDDIATGGEGMHGGALPRVGQHERLQAFEITETHGPRTVGSGAMGSTGGGLWALGRGRERVCVGVGV